MVLPMQLELYLLNQDQSKSVYRLTKEDIFEKQAST